MTLQQSFTGDPENNDNHDHFFLRASQKGNPLLSLSFAVSAASMPFKMCCRLWEASTVLP
jgi:hypothetical protein